MKKNILLAVLFLVNVYGDNQKETSYSQTFHACIQEIQHPNVCLEAEIKLQDKKLNTAYKNAKKSILPSRVEALKKVQKVWIKYRDSKCGFFYHKQSGSGGLTDELQCILDTSIQRTNELKLL